MRLMTFAEGPALLSELSNAQAVLRPTPMTEACLAVVSHPAAIKASRISSSFEACLALARRFFLVPRIVYIPLINLLFFVLADLNRSGYRVGDQGQATAT